MNENRINIFKCFIYSIAGFDKYRILLRQSMGKAVGYLMLLAFLMSAVVFVPFYSMTYEISNSALSYVIEKIPDFRLYEGRLEVYGEMPIVFDEGDVPVVIDTSPGAEDRILSQYDIVFLFTDSKMVMKNYVNRQEYPFSAFNGLDITKDSLTEAMPIIKAYINIIFIISAVFLVIIFVGAKFISALIVSIIGLIANSSSKTNLSYKNIFKLSMFSMTLPLVICTVIDALMINIPLMSALFYIGSGIYIYGAIRSIKKELEAAGGGWDPYGSDTFNGNNYRNSSYDNFSRGNGNPGSNGSDYRYGSLPNRPSINDSNSSSNETGAAAGAPADEQAKASDGNAADERQENNESDEK